jgi:ribosome biogenesis GTPase A
VTRQLRWIRISSELELLDAPGVLPSRLDDQEAAAKLAICDDIGEAAYDNQRVAADLVERLKTLQQQADWLDEDVLRSRYDLSAAEMTGETYLVKLAEQNYQNDVERSARQLLNDFRKGTLGAIALELPPDGNFHKS